MTEGEIFRVSGGKENEERYTMRIGKNNFSHKIYLSPDLDEVWQRKLRNRSLESLMRTRDFGWYADDKEEGKLRCAYCDRQVDMLANEKGIYLYKMPCTCKAGGVDSSHERTIQTE